MDRSAYDPSNLADDRDKQIPAGWNFADADGRYGCGGAYGAICCAGAACARCEVRRVNAMGADDLLGGIDADGVEKHFA